MKINLDINSYEIKDLKSIVNTIEIIKKLCKNLETLSTTMERNISVAEREFNSVNMERTKAVIAELKKNLGSADIEFDELLRSVNDYLAKIQNAWNTAWR